jgi:dTDP-4-dehydrorhamnose reductase
VFDGRAEIPLKEDHVPAPLGVYGQSKLEGEEAIRRSHDQHLILRTSWLFSAHGSNFVKTMLALVSSREEVRVVADQTGCPTCSADIAGAIMDLAIRWEREGSLSWGTYHFCGKPPTSWYGFAEEIMAQARKRQLFKVKRIRAITTAQYPTPALRPAYSVLSCDKLEKTFGIRPPDWRVGLQTVLEEICHE